MTTKRGRVIEEHLARIFIHFYYWHFIVYQDWPNVSIFLF